ncbi:MAG: hypothetical protein EDM05_027950 [Leptolyngbya sp. IPPAS B-1204]|nr:hypothetical protein [Elainella sp. C42_A2020_010]
MPILLDYQNREVRLTEERLAHILAHPTDKNLAEQELKIWIEALHMIGK